MNTRKAGLDCEKCGRGGKVRPTYTARAYCDTHFMEMVEKRMRRSLRINKEINVKRKYLLTRTTPHETRIARHFLKKIFSDRLEITETNSLGSPETTIIPGSLDKEAKDFLESFLENKDFKKRFVNPLRVVLEEEIKEICRILKIKYVGNTIKNMIIKSAEEKYPGTKFSLMKSMEEITKK